MSLVYLEIGPIDYLERAQELVNVRNRLNIEVLMDMNTGQILKERSSRLASWFNRNDTNRLAADIAVQNRFNLKQAMALAGKNRKGLILKSELEYKHQVVLAEVEMLMPNGKQTLRIDVRTKKLIHPPRESWNESTNSLKAPDEAAFTIVDTETMEKDTAKSLNQEKVDGDTETDRL